MGLRAIVVAACMALSACTQVTYRHRRADVYRTNSPNVVWVVVEEESSRKDKGSTVSAFSLWVCVRPTEPNAAPECRAPKWSDPAAIPSLLRRWTPTQAEP